ncbi:MAG: alginate export family protein [bacterium]
MKWFVKGSFVFALSLISVIPAFAGTEIKFDAQVRVRSQADDKNFDTAYSMNDYSELRTRVGMNATVEENTHVYIQLQDSRVFGENNQFGKPSSGTLNDSKNVDLHQGYIKIDKIFGKGWGGQAGRFEFIKGNQRFFGNVGWSNVGRSWDGSVMWYKNNQFQITGFVLKSLELKDMTYNRDTDVLGLYAEINKLNLDLFAVLEENADTNGYSDRISSLNRYNLGMYYHHQHNQFDFEMNGVYQFGTLPSSDIYDVDSVDAWEMDIAASMLNFEGVYNFEGNRNAQIAIGADYSSGNDFKDSTKYNAYTNAYYTGHKFRGYMDYFISSHPAGLIDLLFRVKMDPAPGWTLNGDFHYFTTAKEYPIIEESITRESNDVGMEFDFTISTTKVAGVSLAGGVSIFLPEEDWAGITDPDPGVWAYTMATVDIK